MIGLQELAAGQAAAIDRELADLYPHRLLHPDGFAGRWLLSRHPIAEADHLRDPCAHTQRLLGAAVVDFSLPAHRQRLVGETECRPAAFVRRLRMIREEAAAKRQVDTAFRQREPDPHGKLDIGLPDYQPRTCRLRLYLIRSRRRVADRVGDAACLFVIRDDTSTIRPPSKGPPNHRNPTGRSAAAACSGGRPLRSKP